MVIFHRSNEKACLQATICGSADGLSLWNHSVSVILIFALSYIISFFTNTRAFTFQKAFSAAPSGRFQYALSAKSGTVLGVMQGHRIPYWLPAINSFVVSAAVQKTYVTQKAPRSTLPLNLTVSGQSRKAYVERGALFIDSAANRAFGVLWVCRFLW